MRNGKRRMAARLAVTAAIMVAGFGVVSAHAANKLIVKDAAGTTDKMVVTDQGQVGAGTNAPLGPFHAIGNSYATTQFIGQWNGTSTNGGAGFLGFHNNDNGALPNKGDRLGYFLFGSLNGASRLVGAGMTVKAEENWTPTAFPTSISFDTALTTGRIQRLIITGSGNVGVGVTPPSVPTQKLEVNGGVRLNTATAKPTCDASTRGTFWVTKGAVGVADKLEICLKGDAGSTENYAWKGL